MSIERGHRKIALRDYSNLKLFVVVFIIFSYAASVIISSKADVSSPVEINVYPASQIVEAGEEFTVNISIDPANSSITSAQFNLLFNSSLVEVKNVTEGNLFKQNGASTMFSSGIINTNNTEATLIDVWDVIITPGANITTKGILATITMNATNAGTSQLNLTNVIISDPNSQAIQVNITNGSIVVQANITNASLNASTVDITPPASITNLSKISASKNYINWTWTDPADSDFAEVMVYINGIFMTNITRGTEYYKAANLNSNTFYTIGTHTVDTSNNVNNTWVNNSCEFHGHSFQSSTCQ